MAITRSNHLWLHLCILMSILAISRAAVPEQCVYTLYIRTGMYMWAGTGSKISATLYDSRGNRIEIGNVVTWGGLNGPHHKYFEMGDLDIFSNRAPCLPAPICALNLTSDGSGPGHDWYCEYVDVTTTAVQKNCAKQSFTVKQWLSRDKSPYQLSVIRDNCGKNAVVKDYKAQGSPSLVTKA